MNDFSIPKLNQPTKTQLDAIILTPDEERVLNYSMDPSTITLTPIEIAQDLKLGFTEYLNIISNIEFQRKMLLVSAAIIRSKIQQVVLATAEFAVSSPKNTADRKLMMQAAGILADDSTSVNIKFNSDTATESSSISMIIEKLAQLGMVEAELPPSPKDLKGLKESEENNIIDIYGD